MASHEPSNDRAANGGFDTATGRGSFNTIKPDPKHSWTYSTKMAISFALTAVMTAAIFVMVLAVVWESQFKAYTRSNMQSLAQSAADTLAIGYDTAGSWTPEHTAMSTRRASSPVGAFWPSWTRTATSSTTTRWACLATAIPASPREQPRYPRHRSLWSLPAWLTPRAKR